MSSPRPPVDPPVDPPVEPPVDPLADDPPSIAELARAGLTADEIAGALGLTADAVRASREYNDVGLTDAHDARVELALYELAVGAVTWRESLAKTGTPVRLYKRIPPDAAAARLLLQARRPQQWGAADAGDGTRVYVVALPSPATSAADWLARIESDRRAIDVTPGGRSDGRGAE